MWNIFWNWFKTIEGQNCSFFNVFSKNQIHLLIEISVCDESLLHIRSFQHKDISTQDICHPWIYPRSIYFYFSTYREDNTYFRCNCLINPLSYIIAATWNNRQSDHPSRLSFDQDWLRFWKVQILHSGLSETFNTLKIKGNSESQVVLLHLSR